MTTNKILKALIRALLDKAGVVDVDFVENHFLPELRNQGLNIVKRRKSCKST